MEKWQEIANFCSAHAGDITPEISTQLNAHAFEGMNLIEGFAPFDEDHVIRDNLISEQIPFTSPATQTLINSLQSIEFSSKLALVTKPVLCLSGAYDFVVPKGMAIEMYETVNSVVKERRVFLNTGHNLEE